MKLTRSDDGMIAGVCGGIADYFGWSPFRVRLMYVVASLLSAAFPGIIVYLMLWFLMPAKGPMDQPPNYRPGA
jgi:phage shock protein PspC (stress-responsive transcriptional regulator)